MPLYDFRCEDCGEQVTIRQSFSDDTLPRCVSCGSDRMSRLISRVSIVKSEQDRTRDLSWIDRDMAARIKKKATGKLNPALQETVDRMESH